MIRRPPRSTPSNSSAASDVYKRQLFYRYHAAVALTTVEANNTVNEGEESVILAHANILTRIVNSTALTNDDVASNASLTTPNLNA